MSFVQRVLLRIFIAITWHPLLTISVALVLAVFSIFYTVRNLEFQTSQMDLISPKHRLVQLSGEIDQFDNLDNFVVAIESRDTVPFLEVPSCPGSTSES